MEKQANLLIFQNCVNFEFTLDKTKPFEQKKRLLFKLILPSESTCLQSKMVKCFRGLKQTDYPIISTKYHNCK